MYLLANPVNVDSVDKGHLLLFPLTENHTVIKYNIKKLK